MVLTDIIEELKEASSQVSEKQIDKFIDSINSHKRIFVYGTGRSGLMLKAFAMRLMQIGKTAYVIGETTTPSVASGDLLVVASASGETQSVCNTADNGVKQGTDVIVITGGQESTLSKAHNPLIRLEAATKYTQSKASIQPLGSLFEQMLLLIFDAVILKMSLQDAESNQEMAKRHASIE